MRNLKLIRILSPLHRAISVMIFDLENKNILLQKRVGGKVTWPLFWSNACCTHPFIDESYLDAAKRRLMEEMGFVADLRPLFKFSYSAIYDETWGENEMDMVFIGNYDGEVKPNPDEVAEFKWVDVDELKKDIKIEGSKYTPWFKLIMEKLR